MRYRTLADVMGGRQLVVVVAAEVGEMWRLETKLDSPTVLAEHHASRMSLERTHPTPGMNSSSREVQLTAF
jgi:hypothetical protein